MNVNAFTWLRAQALRSSYPIWNVRHTQQHWRMPLTSTCVMVRYVCCCAHARRWIYFLFCIYVHWFIPSKPTQHIDTINKNKIKAIFGVHTHTHTHRHTTYPEGIFVLSNIHKLKSSFWLPCVWVCGDACVQLSLSHYFIFSIFACTTKNKNKSRKEILHDRLWNGSNETTFSRSTK